MSITQSRLQDLLSYDPETGLFTWLVQRGPARAGDVAGCVSSGGYCRIRLDGRLYEGHRLVWLYLFNRAPAHEIDHVNGLRHDNRLVNLREATDSQNQGNRALGRDNKSGFKGVFWRESTERWYAKITYQGKQKHLGSFTDSASAKAAYDQAAGELFGEFARPA